MKILSLLDILALIDLHPPLNRFRTIRQNVEIWEAELKSPINGVLTEDDVLPSLNLWSDALMSKFDINEPRIREMIEANKSKSNKSKS